MVNKKGKGKAVKWGDLEEKEKEVQKKKEKEQEEEYQATNYSVGRWRLIGHQKDHRLHHRLHETGCFVENCHLHPGKKYQATEGPRCKNCRTRKSSMTKPCVHNKDIPGPCNYCHDLNHSYHNCTLLKRHNQGWEHYSSDRLEAVKNFHNMPGKTKWLEDEEDMEET